MRINGIIAEYNPFHNGHRYHLEQAKQQNNADYNVIVMSGNFTQRGEPAILDKFQRAKLALENGADLVLELPCSYSCASAEYYGAGAIALLDRLGIITHLSFGSECGDIEVLSKIADIFLKEPEEFSKALRSQLKLGYSYPIARTQALLIYSPELSKEKDVLSSSNNILGIEYLKALQRQHSAIVPTTVKRLGADYRDQRMGESQCSALAIRQAVFSCNSLDGLHYHLPEALPALLTQLRGEQQLINCDDFSEILYYKLLLHTGTGYTEFFDVSKELSDRILNLLPSYRSFSQFCDLLKSKGMTHTRISRCLLHILLDYRTSRLDENKAAGMVPYARVLGFRKDSGPLMNLLQEKAQIPILTKLSDAADQLDEQALDMLQWELMTNRIYLGTIARKTGATLVNEYRVPLMVV